MAYISLIIGRRGFGGKDDLWEIICPESYGGVTFDLGSDLTFDPSFEVERGRWYL